MDRLAVIRKPTPIGGSSARAIWRGGAHRIALAISLVIAVAATLIHVRAGFMTSAFLAAVVIAVGCVGITPVIAVGCVGITPVIAVGVGITPVIAVGVGTTPGSRRDHGGGRLRRDRAGDRRAGFWVLVIGYRFR